MNKKETPLWEQIADEWDNRGYHSEELPDGRIRLWYDGIVRNMLIDRSDSVPFPDTFLHERRRAERMQDPEFREGYEEEIDNENC